MSLHIKFGTVLHRLGIPGPLRRALSNTGAMESADHVWLAVCGCFAGGEIGAPLSFVNLYEKWKSV